jgi:hypothetical protein
MKAYLDQLVMVNVLDYNRSEWQDDISYYQINKGFQIAVVKNDKQHTVDKFQFDYETDVVTVQTTSEVDNGEWDGEWYLEFDDITPDQLIIERVTRVTLEELQG